MGAPSFLMASIRAATFSMEARVSARRSCGERDLVAEDVVSGLAGASTSMASAVGAAAIGSAGAGRDDDRGVMKWVKRKCVRPVTRLTKRRSCS